MNKKIRTKTIYNYNYPAAELECGFFISVSSILYNWPNILKYICTNNYTELYIYKTSSFEWSTKALNIIALFSLCEVPGTGTSYKEKNANIDNAL